MDAKAIKAVVDDFAAWKGNAYTLASLIAAQQQEADAALAEAAEQPELAELIRSN